MNRKKGQFKFIYFRTYRTYQLNDINFVSFCKNCMSKKKRKKIFYDALSQTKNKENNLLKACTRSKRTSQLIELHCPYRALARNLCYDVTYYTVILSAHTYLRVYLVEKNICM